MYTPYAYTEDQLKDQTLLDILNVLNPTYCDCTIGSVAEALGTLCPGTCLDYAYDHQAPYSFAFEIYNRFQFAPGWTPQTSLLQANSRKTKINVNRFKLMIFEK